MAWIVSYFTLCAVLVQAAFSSDPVPIVLWHGMGDSCCFSFSMGAIKALLQEQLPGVYVYSVRLGGNEMEDVENSYFGNVNKQVEVICDRLAADEKLRNGYNAIGFSQGSQFLRAVAQRCPKPPMKNYISIGGQHQGVFGLPNCAGLEQRICDYLRRMFKYGVYLKFVQEKFVQASYWHDPLQEDEYKSSNLFLADINNEIHLNETYKNNLQKLESMVFVKFEGDTLVIPTESEWFGFYTPGQANKVQTLQESELYKEDRLGLKTLADNGRLHFLSLPGNHLRFNDTWFVENIIQKFLV